MPFCRQCTRSTLFLASLLVTVSFSSAFVPLADRRHLCHRHSSCGRKDTNDACKTTSPRSQSTKLNAYEPPVPKFCSECGAADMSLQIPPGDERTRAMCGNCGYTEYQNPKPVVSCVVITENKRILLAKRAIEPRKGTWGIPQGFMEHGETTRQAAAREVVEETGAIVKPENLIFRAIYNVPGSVQLVYSIQVSSGDIEEQIAKHNTDTGESSEVELIPLDKLDQKELCFPTVQWALDHCLSQFNNDTRKIQQKTKYYDAEHDEWSEYEDVEPLPSFVFET